MAVATSRLRLLLLGAAIAASFAAASGAALVGETCAASSGCGAGLRCTSCTPPPGTGPAACARTTPVDPKTHGTELPFNNYSWLTTHNSFAVVGTKSPTGSAIIAPPNQEDSVTAQLKNGVRGLMLDTYDFNNDVWLCHSFNGKCLTFTAYQPALNVLKEIQAFLESNPSEVITIFLEDYTAPGSLGKVFNAAGLTKYWFPVAKMPKNGGDWPPLKDMISQDQRLVVFTSKQGKEASEGLAHEWNYVVESQYGSEGLVQGKCRNRAESRPMDSTAQSLVLINFFTTNPSQSWACGNNSSPLVTRLKTCYDASAKRWPNFIAVDFYMRSNGGGAPLATDVANGRLHCGCDNIAYCKANAPFGTCSMPSSPSPVAAAPSSKSSPSPAPMADAPPKSSPSPGPSPAAPPKKSRSQSPRPAVAARAPPKSLPSPLAATAPSRSLEAEEVDEATATWSSGAPGTSSAAPSQYQQWSFFFGLLGSLFLTSTVFLSSRGLKT
ncbi:PI-PLC X domain-containing protein At5g67130-like [Phragmites australis]|uniref:PI-PLC X domain-containing protein At5g67130-like n=1 Tax=Phragmites australis TaxID=29695 RepID=UPI002D765DBD|nr:PI-PLC X domain-containing protein At5g67130-like [Phragmites australis]